MLFPGTGALTAPPSHVLLAPSAPSDPGQRGLPGERAVLVGLDASIQSLLLIQRESGHRLSGGGFPKELSSGNYLSARQLSRATPETADTQHRLCCRRVRGCTHQPRGVCVWSACLCLQWWNMWGLEGADPSQALELWPECRNTGSESKHFRSFHTRLLFGMA